MLFLYNENEKKDFVSIDDQVLIERKNNGKSLVNTFSDYHYDYVLKKDKNKGGKEFFWGI